jgi:uncharacterized membrane protein YqjE
MELEALIAIPALVFLGALIYLLLVNRQGNNTKEVELKLPVFPLSSIAQYDVLKVLFAGTTIMIIMVLVPWFIFYVRSGARLSFMTNYLSVLFILSMLIFPFTFYFFKKKNEGR